MKKNRLFLLILLAPMCLLCIDPPAISPQAEATAATVFPGDLLDGADFDFAVSLQADERGNFGPCGWPRNPMGGFARRMSYWNAHANRYPHKPILKVNGGSIFSYGSAEAPIRNRWMLEGTYRSDLDAINLSAWDLPVWQEMSDLASAGQLPAEWMNLPLVSANVRPKVPNFPPVRRSIIKDISIGDKPGRHVRVAITGLLSDPDERISRTEFDVQDPESAVRQVLTELEGKADYRVVVTDDTLGRAISLAVNVPGIDLLVVAHDYNVPDDAQLVGNTLLVVPVNEGRMISEVRLAADPAAPVFRPSAHFIPLDRKVPDDPAMAGLQRKAEEQLDDFKKGKG